MSSGTVKKSCLITGGAGFIGSHLCEALLSQGHTVRVLDNFSTGHRQNLLGVEKDCQIIEGDIRDYETVRKAADGVDVIFHQAAMASVFESMKNPSRNHDINVNGTFHVIEAARQAGVPRFVFASSAAVYGPAIEKPITEGFPIQPVSPYGLSKHMGEEYCHQYAHIYDMQTVCFRYFNVYGPRQDPKSAYSGVISVFTNTILEGGTPIVYGDGKQSRDFVHVSDVVQANLLAMTSEGDKHQVFNVANGQQHNLLEVLEILKQHTGKTFNEEYREERRGDVRDSLADISKIKSRLGFNPGISFKEGLSRYADYTIANMVSTNASTNA